MNVRLVLAVALGAAFFGAASGADLYVSTNDVHSVAGDDRGWGTYWTDDGIAHDAYTNLQQASMPRRRTTRSGSRTGSSATMPMAASSSMVRVIPPPTAD